MTVRVLLADDEQLIRAGLRALLSADPEIEVVGEASDGELAVYLARRLEPDVVLMDIRMPRLEGIAATRRVAGEQPGVRVVVLTTFGLDEYVYDALRAGASGSCSRTPPPTSCATRSTPRPAGRPCSPPASRRCSSRRSRRNAGEPTGRPAMTSSRLASATSSAWSPAAGPTPRSPTTLGVSEATVKSHVTPVLAKLGLRDRAQAIVLAHEHGLVEGGLL